ncbi:hypothetical protein B0H19DRAFT_1258065 [Mycena capillaripes]|nr:hypothetical protein B0H19DRAFT_1258065 [Mycena capillaripes]
MTSFPHPQLFNKAKIPFNDSSNRTSCTPTKHHAHLRTYSAPSLRKSPPTCTLSLASVTARPALSIASEMPLSAPSCVPFPSDDVGLGSCNESPAPEPWRRPRARTSHVQTPRRVQPPPTPTRRISNHTNPGMSTSRSVPSAADLRLAALVERSIAQHVATRAVSALFDLDEQDALLVARLGALLALHGRRVRPTSPTIGIAPPSPAPSVLFSGNNPDELFSGSCSVIVSPTPMATPSPLRFIISRARSGSRGSITSGTTTLSMPALVATLLLRRHEGGRASAATFYAKRRMPPSPLSVHIFSVSHLSSSSS